MNINETIRQLFERKSVRVFEERPILEKEKNLILEAAAMAPTAGNQQLYTILDITDPGIKEKLSETCDHQPFIAKAKLVLIFCADCRKWYEAFRETGCAPRVPGAGDLLLAVSDAVIAAQNAVTAAWSLGIGSCYIGDIMENCEAHRELLKLPPYVFPAAMLVFGYPTAQQLQRPKPARAELSHIVHENGYRRMSPQEHEKLFGAKAGEKSYREWMQAFCKRKYNSDFSREMTRSAEVYLKDFLEPERNGEIEYRTLSEEELSRELFRGFIRHQNVTKCWRREKEAWVVKDAPFVDDWTDADYEFLVACLKNTVRTGGFVYGAFRNEILKGFVSVESALFGEKERYLDLSSIHVSEDLRGNGIGAGLFAAAKEWAGKRGAEKLYISAHSAVETQAFYKKMGCVEAKEYCQKHVDAEPFDCQLECAVKSLES